MKMIFIDKYYKYLKNNQVEIIILKVDDEYSKFADIKKKKIKYFIFMNQKSKKVHADPQMELKS